MINPRDLISYFFERNSRRSYKWWRKLPAEQRDNLIIKHILGGPCGSVYRPHHEMDGWVAGVCWQGEGKP